MRKALAETIRELRAQGESLSQEKLALKSEVDRAYMSEIERELRSPTIETLNRLIIGLGINWAEFGRIFDRHLRRPKD